MYNYVVFCGCVYVRDGKGVVHVRREGYRVVVKGGERLCCAVLRVYLG